MCDKQIKYNTELTDEHLPKYRNVRDSGELKISKFVPRSLLYPNDMHMISKTFDGAKVGTVAGFGAGFVMANDQTGFQGPLRKTFPSIAEHFFKHFTPWFLAGSMYGFGTSLAANYRHKEDYINHIVGGATGGSVFGMWYRNTRMGFWCMAIGGILGGSLKYMRENNLNKDTGLRPRVFNMYRKNWFMEPIDPQGTDDDEYKYYKP